MRVVPRRAVNLPIAVGERQLLARFEQPFDLERRALLAGGDVSQRNRIPVSDDEPIEGVVADSDGVEGVGFPRRRRRRRRGGRPLPPGANITEDLEE